MTNPAYEATNSDVEKLIARTKQLSSLMVERFSMNPIGAKILREDWEREFPDHEAVAQCFNALIAALEQAQQYSKKRDEENQDLMLTIGRLRVEREQLESAPNGMMQLSNELAELERKCAELEARSITVKWPDYVDGRTLGYGEVNHMIDLCVDAVELACHASGIRIKSED